MRRETYDLLEAYMRSCMGDSAHDQEHVRRVLYTALDIAGTEPEVNMDVLIAACLLHDIARAEQFADPAVCHARAGAEKAERFLLERGFGGRFAAHVAACVRTHRFRSGDPPESVEAKVLFDADKLDVTGAVGIARTLLYQGREGEPIYTLRPDGQPSDGSDTREPSFFREYKFKLEGVYDKFFTVRGAALARQRRQAAADFCQSLLREVRQDYETGPGVLQDLLV